MRVRKNTFKKFEESYNEFVPIEEFKELVPGSGKGKTAVIICFTKYISLSSKLISTKTYESIKNFLLEVYQYDKVDFSSTFQYRSNTDFEFFKGCMIPSMTPHCLDEYDDIFHVQAAMNMFMGYIYDDYFYNVLRINEWYQKHGDGHYFVIQDDPAISYIDPFPVLNRRTFEYKTLGHEVPEEVFQEYIKVWPNVQKCLHNCIVAHCGTSYPTFLSKLSPNNAMTPKFVSKWCQFPLFTYQAMTDNISNKLHNYDYSSKKYDSE